MRSIDNELKKLNSISIKRQNPILRKIESQERVWIEDFNRSLEEVFKDKLLPIIEELSKTPNIDKIKTRKIIINEKEYIIPENILQDFHKSFIEDYNLREYYEDCLKKWFSDKTDRICSTVKDISSYKEMMGRREYFFSLASLAVTSFHKKPHIILRNAQKRTAIALSEGSVAELASGEGKTLAAVLAAYMQGLTKRGVHVMTANNYLSRRDYEELKPIYNGLGVSIGYNPSDVEDYAALCNIDYDKLSKQEKDELYLKMIEEKREAYQQDITFGEASVFAFDYLRDNSIKSIYDMIQRPNKPGFGICDEIDLFFIDNATTPLIISASPQPTYKKNMSLQEFCDMLGISYQKVLGTNAIKNPEKITYEEARYLALYLKDCDILEDPSEYQMLANEFINDGDLKIEKVSKNTFDDFEFDDSNNPDIAKLKERTGIIVCDELGRYRVSSETYDRFIRLCYLRIHINSHILKNKDKIIEDKHYIENEDYSINNDSLVFSSSGLEKIVSDLGYPDIIEDYEKFLSRASEYSATIINFLNQAITANLLLKKEEHYIVDNGEVKLLRNGRIQPGSKYSNGLHQAIEIKEHIPESKRTKETLSVSSVTQVNFVSRYDMFSGMTGTASQEIFGNVYKKGVVSIPRAVVEEKEANELTGVDVRDIQFTLNREDKINLILQSILESQTEGIIKQPVLVVVADPNEIGEHASFLESRLGDINVLNAEATKNNELKKEALIISVAGLPGKVTVATEMAGRGTDIILGGDRDVVLDYEQKDSFKLFDKVFDYEGKIREMVESSIEPDIENREAIVEAEYRRQLKEFEESPIFKEIMDNLRKKVEESYKEKGGASLEEQQDNKSLLEKVGLKVIISGLFGLKRSEEQVKGRTGRNGVSGICEEYVCPDDLKRIGIISLDGKSTIEEFLRKFKREPNGRLEIDKKTYERIRKLITIAQQKKEIGLQNNIKSTQELNIHSSRMIEELRDQRRMILLGVVDVDKEFEEMIVETVDAIISSYISLQSVDKKMLTAPIDTKVVDIEAIIIEIKQVLGVEFDPNIIDKSRMNLLEFRDYIIKTAEKRRKDLKNNKKDIEILLEQNDFVISCAQEILDKGFTAKRIRSLLSELGTSVDDKVEFANERRRVIIESYKHALRLSLGLTLSVNEFVKLEEKKKNIYAVKINDSNDQSIEDYDVKESPYEENNLGVIDRLRSIKRKLDKKDEKKLRRLDYLIRSRVEKNKDKALVEINKDSLNVRPVNFINAIINKNNVVGLVNLVRNAPAPKEQNAMRRRLALPRRTMVYDETKEAV